MRNYVMKGLYRRAVQHFGSENYRKAFNCTPYLSILQADYRSRRNPVSLRLSTIQELREALKLQNSKPNAITESFSSVNTIGELLPLLGEPALLLHETLSKIGVTGSCNCSFILSRESSLVDECFWRCLDGYKSMVPLLQQFSWLTLRIHSTIKC